MTPKRKPIILEVDVIHPCFCVDVPEKMKDSRMKYLAFIGRDAKSVSSVFEVRSPHLAEFLERVRKHPLVREVSILRKSDNVAEIAVKANYEPTVIKGLDASKCVFLEPTVYEGGVEKVTLLAPSEENMHRFFESLDKSYDVKLKSKRYLRKVDQIGFSMMTSSGYPKLKAACELLTDKQLEAFEFACKHGYYEEPKKATLSELALELGIAEGTLAEHLRKAEAKLMPTLMELLKALK